MIKCFLLHIFVGVFVLQEINAKAGLAAFRITYCFSRELLYTNILFDIEINWCYLSWNTDKYHTSGFRRSRSHIYWRAAAKYAPFRKLAENNAYRHMYIASNSLSVMLADFSLSFLDTIDMIDTRHGLICDHTCKNLCWMRHMKSAKWLQT